MNKVNREHKIDMVIQIAGGNPDHKAIIALKMDIDTTKYDFTDIDSMWKLYDDIEIQIKEAADSVIEDILNSFGIYADHKYNKYG